MEMGHWDSVPIHCKCTNSLAYIVSLYTRKTIYASEYMQVQGICKWMYASTLYLHILLHIWIKCQPYKAHWLGNSDDDVLRGLNFVRTPGLWRERLLHFCKRSEKYTRNYASLWHFKNLLSDQKAKIKTISTVLPGSLGYLSICSRFPGNMLFHTLDTYIL